jgi:hypothetical protein
MKDKKSKNKHIIVDPNARRFIVMNEYLQVWTGLRDGGRTATFSDNIDDAKTLEYDEQFKYLNRIVDCKLMKDYI